MQISKRTFGIIIVTISLIGMGVWAYFLFIYTTPPAVTETPGETDTFIPGNGLNPPATPGSTPPENNESIEPSPVIETPVALILRQLVKTPVSGAVYITKTRPKPVPLADPAVPADQATPAKKVIPLKPEVEYYTAVRYADKATGHVYEFALDKSDPAKLISGTDIPRSHEAIFGDKGDSVIMRYLKNDNQTIATFAGSLPKDILGGDALPETKGQFLDENISDISMAPDSSKMFYLSPFGEKMIGITSTPLGGKKAQIFDSAFHGWTSQWINLKWIGISTKPSGLVPGFSYMIDISAKKMKRVVGGINGLISNFSPSGSLLAYSDSNASLRIYDIKTGSYVSAGARTFADKCVWTKDDLALYCAVPGSLQSAIYPDAWYDGSVSFTDGLWKFDAKTGNSDYLYDLSDSTEIDAIKLALNESEDHLFFANKKDSSLWSLKLK